MEISINKTNLSTDGEDYYSHEDDKTFDNKKIWDKLLIWNLAWNNKKEYSFYELSFSNNGILRSPDKASQDSPPTIYLNNKEITWGNCLICIIYWGINQENFLQWICLLGKVFIYFLSPVTLHHLQWIMYG